MKHVIETVHLKSVDSTNKYAMNICEKKHLLTVLSDIQTAGRGRIGRAFFSYFGGLYMSVIVDPLMIGLPYHIITPAAALAVKKTLVECGVNEARIKWVNDIYLHDKKVCGILTEAKTDNNSIERIVVGIGLKIRTFNTVFPEEIQTKAGFVSVAKDREYIAKRIAENLGVLLNEDKQKIADEYGKNIMYIGETVGVCDYKENKTYRAKILGVNDDCFLKAELDDGSVRYLSSGEII